MSVHRITLDLDDDEYSAIANALAHHREELNHRLYDLDLKGIDNSAMRQDVDTVAELIAKIEEAVDEGEEL